MGWMLGVLALASLACSTADIPVLSRQEPTNTPRATRTSRPTFTPTPSDTPTPVNTPTPTRTSTPVATATPTQTNTPVATDTPLPRPPTATFTRRPPTATFTPAPPAPATNTPAPSFAFRVGTVRGWPNCTSNGVFGVVSDANGSRLPGYAIQIFIAGGGKVPGEDAVSTSRSDDRNYERNLFQPGPYEVVLSDGTREISPRVPITVDSIALDNCERRANDPGAGSQWVQVNFTRN